MFGADAVSSHRKLTLQAIADGLEMHRNTLRNYLKYYGVYGRYLEISDFVPTYTWRESTKGTCSPIASPGGQTRAGVAQATDHTTRVLFTASEFRMAYGWTSQAHSLGDRYPRLRRRFRLHGRVQYSNLLSWLIVCRLLDCVQVQITEQARFPSYSYKQFECMVHHPAVEETEEGKILRYPCG
jgi:hypothetical protein